jgi:GNAT superfamily N-acetyltransferase
MLDRVDPTVCPKVKELFAGFSLNRPILDSLLENKGAGYLVVDNREKPSSALAYSLVGNAFLVGTLSQEHVEEIILHLKELPLVCIVCPLDWPLLSRFTQAGFVPNKRLHLIRPHMPIIGDFDPFPYCIKEIKSHHLENCAWNKLIMSFYGSQEQFFAHGKGFCLLDGDKIISESYALIASGRAEICIVTDERYRGKNLGTLLSSYMIKYCYDHAITPYWSCYENNPASAAIARKLGFQQDCEYYFLKWTLPGD